ncbi:replication initiator protein A [Fusobacterium pseudoperiodonticum]|uniref:replication initiator protein A n=1 Tax=Fusobacterium pseudoperiodonticum TaxID=2663009 RepID=UPI0028E3E599|nr:replication initiator protein A [Fusobacterium pseudoperiodonticum]
MKDNEPFYQVPKSLFRLRREGRISLTAFDIYILMMDRYKISCLKENIKSFTDEEGEIYFVYAYNSLMEDLSIKKKHGISKAIEELESLGFIRSKKEHGKATIYYLTSDQKGTTTSDQKGTTTSDQKGTLIIINNKNNINKNNINNNNKENVAAVIRQEIKFLIKIRNIKIDNVLKYCSDLNRIKEVFLYADKNNKSDGWVIACLRDNYSLKQEENQEKEKDYSKTMDEILRGG